MSENEPTFLPLTGCGTALVTPFTADGDLDLAALRELVALQIDEGVDFLVPCGTTGETPTLSRGEQTQVIETVLAAAGGRVPIVAGAGGNNTAAVIDTARAWQALGVDALLSVTPYYNKPTQEGLYQHYTTLAEAVELPIVLYNVPGRTGCNMLPATAHRLATHPNIVAIKEASGNMMQITEMVEGAPEGFTVLSGDDGIVLPLIAVGGRGVISVVSNVAPGLMSDFTRHCLAGHLDAARALQGRLLALTHGCFLETNPIPVKAALAMLGRIQEIYRLPMVPISAGNRQRLAALLAEAGLTAATPA